jgi:transposase-like protein
MGEISCKFCGHEVVIKNGFVRSMQRYRCSKCRKSFVFGDRRGKQKYNNDVRNMVVRMYLNNCGFRRISAILTIPLTTVFFWIKKAGKIVDEMVRNREHERETIEILEMDELYTYIKKKKIKYEYGLLLIGTETKMLRLK